MLKMKVTSADELIDNVWGKEGSPKREAMEAAAKRGCTGVHGWRSNS